MDWSDAAKPGYTPQAFPNRRIRLLLLTRLAVLVQGNLNLVELGPRQTGKTFLLQCLAASFHYFRWWATPANLFYNLATKNVGILGTRKVVVFDEIANTTFGDADATISTLKDYMESGEFSRGEKSSARTPACCSQATSTSKTTSPMKATGISSSRCPPS